MLLSKNPTPWYNSKRLLSFNEVSVALRPFFFAVHPDRYAKHPSIQSQNEKSLQIFNGYMNDLFPVSPSLRPTKVRFCINDSESKEFKDIQINLAGTDPVRIVRDALESCQISTADLKLESQSFRHVENQRQHASSPSSRYTTSNIDEDLLKMYLRKKKKQSTQNNLQESLRTQRDEAVRKTNETKTMRLSIKEEVDNLKRRTYLRDVIWQMDWAETHIRRCLTNTHRLLDQAEKSTKDSIINSLYKNVLRFGRGSFTCCDGSIQFGADHVLEQWEQACIEHSVRKSQIKTLKQCTEQLSSTLGGAQILLPHYKGIAQTLSQLQTLIIRIWRKEAILVRLARAGAGTMVEVVTSYDELAIGTDGRLFIPCNVDVASLVVFMEDNAAKSIETNHKMQALMNELNDTTSDCVHQLNLQSLKWDNSLNPSHVLASVQRLAAANDEIARMVSGLSIRITSNPIIFVSSDGTLSIPVNWK